MGYNKFIVVMAMTVALLSVFLENSKVHAWPALFTRQNNIVNQNQNVNNINIGTTWEHSNICIHGTQRCSNDGSLNGLNSTDLCISNKWIRQGCPQGQQCIQNDWSCASPKQASWVSTVYQKSQPT